MNAFKTLKLEWLSIFMFKYDVETFVLSQEKLKSFSLYSCTLGDKPTNQNGGCVNHH